MAVYLLHFDRPYKHARHYMGWSVDAATLPARLREHELATPGDGRHHRLMEVIRAAGIGFTVARLWTQGTRHDERRMKKSGHLVKLCPICRKEGRNNSEV